MSWHKTSSHSRGYGAEWRKLRLLALARDFELCQMCKRAGVVTAATDVHHVVSRADCKLRGLPSERLDNLESLCSPCHERETNGEPRKVTGNDGWPR